MSVTDGRTKNHVSIIGFVQTGIFRFSTRDISGESYIIRKWQKRVSRGPLLRVHGGTHWYPELPGVAGDTRGYLEVPGGIRRYLGVPGDTRGYPEVPKGTQGYPELPGGTRSYPGYPELPGGRGKVGVSTISL